MKSIKLFILSVLMMVGMLSCASSTDSTDENNNKVTAPEGKVVATIDGVTRTYDAVTVRSQSGSKKLVTIDGGLFVDNKMYRCRITLYEPDAAGTYTIASTEAPKTAQAFVYLNDISYAPSSGTINVTEVSGNKFKGTFEFTASDALLSGKTITLTNGSFNVISLN